MSGTVRIRAKSRHHAGLGWGLAAGAVLCGLVIGCSAGSGRGGSGSSPPGGARSPLVESTNPPDNARDVALDTEIAITFSNPADPDTLEGSIEPTVAFEIAWADDRRTVAVLAGDPLEPLTKYTVTVSAVTLTDGSSLERTYTFSFTTGDGSIGTNGAPTSADAETVQALASSLEAAESAGDDLDEWLEGGMESGDAIAALSDRLSEEPGVVRAVAGEDGRQMAVLFDSGLQVVYDVWDLGPALINRLGDSGDVTAKVTHDRPLPRSASSIGRGVLAKPSDPRAQQVVPPRLWAIPAGNHALAANALQSCAPSGFNLRPHVKKRLGLLGYQVHESSASVRLFEDLMGQHFSIIFIEARGSGAAVLEPILEAPLAGETPPPNTAQAGQKQILTTSTQATPAMLAQYADDLKWGRLKVRVAWYRENNMAGETSVTRCGSFLAVTPNFVRHHNSGRFADHILICLNAGGMLTDALESGWFDLLKDKGTGGHLVSWARQPRYPTTMIALGNLFELMTGADTRTKARTEGENHIAVEGHTVRPPLVSQSLQTAMTALGVAGEHLDLQTGATLYSRWNDRGNDTPDLVLAPVLTDFWLDQGGQGALRAMSPDDAMLKIGGSSLDIGRYGPYSAGEGLLNGFGWKFPVPLNAAGPMSLHSPDGRHSRALTLLTWKPGITVTRTTTLPGPTISVTYALTARALVSPRSRVLTTDFTAWGTPTQASIDGFLDGGGCTASWTVTGSHTSGPVQTRWEGGGSKTLSFREADGTLRGARFRSYHYGDSRGDVISIDVDDSVMVTYRETRTDSATGDVLITDYTHEMSPLSLEIPVFGDLTLTGGTQTSPPGDPDVETISWGRTAPTPAFDAKKYRR